MKKLLLLIFTVALLSCEQSVYVAPRLPDTVSFKQHVVPMFTANCSNSSCHGGAHPQGNLNLEAPNAYKQLWSKDLIDTIRPSHSALYSSLISVDRPMPPSGKLDSFYVQMVLRWIEQGGGDN